MIVICPNLSCGQKYTVRDIRAGHTAACKRCGQTFVIGQRASDTVMVAEALDTRGAGEAAKPADRGEEAPGRLGRFELRSRLGAGAFGSVYRAFDPVLDREVALKVPCAAALESREARARFLREPKAAAHLRHPNIVPIFEAGSDGDRYYIASALVEGRTLQRVVEEERLGFRQSAQIVRDLAEALDYAHRSGVVHRDVKPANIMIDEKGQPLLMDFGLARLAGANEKLTHDGAVMGTPAYMAPEQVEAEAGEVGPASDQYSLGVVLYELLCGETPFSGPPAVLLYNTVRVAPRPPRRKNPAVPRDLETICLRAIGKHATDRYATCREMAEDLRRWLDDEPIRARRMGMLERTARWVRRNPLVACLTMALVLLTLSGLAAVTGLWQEAEAHRREADANLGEADRQRAEATRNAATAERQRGLAERAQREAEGARREAEANLAEVRKQKAEAEKQRNEAEKQRNDAQKARETAQQERAKSDQASVQAEAARKQAVASLAEVEKQRQQAREREKIVRRHLYAAEMNLAVQAWDARNYARVVQLLRKHEPKADEEDLRGFEWHYLADQAGLGGEGPRETPARRLKHGSVVYRIVISSDGTKMVSVGQDRSVRVWEVKTGTVTGVYQLPEDFDWAGSFVIGAPAITAGRDRETEKTKLFPAVRPVVIREAASFGVGPLVVSGNGRFLAVAVASAVSKQIQPGRLLGEPQSRPSTSGAPFREVVLWSTDALKELAVLPDHGEPVAFSPDERTVAMVKLGRDNISGFVHLAVVLYDLANGQLRQTLNTRGGISAIVFSPDGRTVAIRARESERGPVQVTLWDVAAGQLKQKLSIAMTREAAFTPDGNRLTAILPSAGRSPSWIAVYTVNGDSVWTAQAAACNALAISPDGHFAAAWKGLTPGDLDELQRARSSRRQDKAEQHRIQLELQSHTVVRVWDLASGRVVADLAGHALAVRAAAFSPDGKTFATAGEDGAIKFWDAITGAERATLKGHAGGILSLAFSKNGRVLVSAGRDGDICVWTTGPLSGASGPKSP
jgi:WD40 repeat protein/tRNA A-37 threonylcarbamoyl transferase component Bud32